MKNNLKKTGALLLISFLSHLASAQCKDTLYEWNGDTTINNVKPLLRTIFQYNLAGQTLEQLTQNYDTAKNVFINGSITKYTYTSSTKPAREEIMYWNASTQLWETKRLTVTTFSPSLKSLKVTTNYYQNPPWSQSLYYNYNSLDSLISDSSIVTLTKGANMHNMYTYDNNNLLYEKITLRNSFDFAQFDTTEKFEYLYYNTGLIKTINRYVYIKPMGLTPYWDIDYSIEHQYSPNGALTFRELTKDLNKVSEYIAEQNTYTFNNSNQLIQTTAIRRESASIIKFQDQTDYTYDVNGNIDTTFRMSGVPLIKAGRHTYSYNSLGQQIQVNYQPYKNGSYMDYSRIYYTWDANNHITDELRTNFDEVRNKYVNTLRYLHYFDSTGFNYKYERYSFYDRDANQSKDYFKWEYLCGNRTASVSKINALHTAHIYPNPANSAIFVTLQQANKGTPYTILSLTGHVIQQGTLEPNHKLIDISNLNQGVYILALQGHHAIKLIKQ